MEKKIKGRRIFFGFFFGQKDGEERKVEGFSDMRIREKEWEG